MQYEAGTLFSLVGKRAIVTGATGHLGRVMAHVLVDNGAEVIALGRADKSPDHLLETQYYSVDLNDPTSLDDLYSSVPPVDILINNAHPMHPSAGFNVMRDQIGELDETEWDVNLRGLEWAVRLTAHYGRAMKELRRGSIINICTMYSQVAPHPLLYHETQSMNPPGYSASKAALLAFTRYVASFYGRYNVRANAILPGPFPKSITVENGEFIQRLNDRTVMGRTGEPSDLAGLVLFLASDASGYVTGQAISCDGGWNIT